MPSLRIANGAGFLGDWLDAPRRLVERSEVDYLTIEPKCPWRTQEQESPAESHRE